ncbi:MAG: DNA internalization-related competence protein ComEC/Rec2 [Burkholderiales bacterium]
MRLFILGFVFGVWFLQQQAQLPDLRYAWVVPLLAVAWLTAQKFRLKYSASLGWAFLIVLAIGCGFHWAAWRAQVRIAEHLPAEWEGRDISVIGVVASLPQKTARGLRFEFDIEKKLTVDALAPGHVSLNFYRDSRVGEQGSAIMPDIRAGERWQWTVRLRKPHGAVNPGGFDVEAWLLERNVRAVGYVRSKESMTRIDARADGFHYRVDRLREGIRENFARVLNDKPLAPILTALAIGDQSGIGESQWQLFWRTGVGHLISISGLHITMVASLFYGLALWLWRSRPALTLRVPAQKIAVIAGMISALAYSLVAGFSVPTQRTFYMLATAAVFLWTGRLASPSRVLSAAMLVVMLLDPWAVLAPGFWLSFGAVGALMYVSAGRAGKIFWLRSMASAQAAIALLMAPLLLVLFQQVSLVSPVANAVAIPVVSFVVTPLTLIGTLPPFEFCLLLAHKVMEWCMGFLHWVAQMPAAAWQSHAPPVWTMLLGVIGMLWVLAPRGVPARWLGIVWALPMFLLLPDKPAPGQLWLTVLDVGQGLSVVAQTRHHALLYDTGPGYDEESDAGKRIVAPYLRVAGIDHLDGMVVTHADSDHSGGAISVLQSVPTGWLLSALARTSEIHKYAIKSNRCENGQSWDWDGVKFEMLHPTADDIDDQTRKINNNGCVLKLTSAHGSALLTADIEQFAEAELLQRESDIRADVLVAPHHGSKTSSTPEFVDAVGATNVIFTVGYRNRFGHPKQEVVERYAEVGANIFRSDEDGAVLVKFDGAKKIGISPWRRHDRRYWRE